VNEAHIERLVRRDRFAGHRDPTRPVRANDAREPADAARAGKHREVRNLGQPEDCTLTGEAEVARRAHLDPEAQTRPLGCEHDGLLDPFHLVEQFMQSPIVTTQRHPRRWLLTHLVDVFAGGEVAPLSGDHHGSDRLVVAKARNTAAERVKHLVGDGVSTFGRG
jgi:hypothetical protein